MCQGREDQSDLANWTRGDRKARFEQTAERHAGLSQFAALPRESHRSGPPDRNGVDDSA